MKWTAGLQDLIPDEWFERPEQSSAWFRIYTTLAVPHDQYLESVDELVSGIASDQKLLESESKVALNFCIMEEMLVQRREVLDLRLRDPTDLVRDDRTHARRIESSMNASMKQLTCVPTAGGRFCGAL